jgi:HlyD family secretion protein
MVHKGQVLATLEQSLFQAAVEQAQANVTSAEADAQRLRVTKTAADVLLGRDQNLAAQQMLPAQDLETAVTGDHTAGADVVSADAKVDQAKADLENAKVSLAKTVITSPIDGVVTARDVDMGQTVASSFQAPTLFEIAADLEHMQVSANIDESDVGMVKQGQNVTFRVDAFPNDTFHGTVSQVRLNAATVNNVVTYSAIIDAPNPKFQLMPGMTANLTIEVDRRDGVLRVPASALRFKVQPAALIPHPSAGIMQAVATKPLAPPPSTSGTLWRPDGSAAYPTTVKTGLSDGTLTELVDAPLAEGTVVVTGVTRKPADH